MGFQDRHRRGRRSFPLLFPVFGAENEGLSDLRRRAGGAETLRNIASIAGGGWMRKLRETVSLRHCAHWFHKRILLFALGSQSENEPPWSDHAQSLPLGCDGPDAFLWHMVQASHGQQRVMEGEQN